MPSAKTVLDGEALDRPHERAWLERVDDVAGRYPHVVRMRHQLRDAARIVVYGPPTRQYLS